MKGTLNFLSICLLMGLSVTPAWSAVLSHDDLTAASAGVANAVVAGADDLSAAIYNPAGLAWQEGVQGMAGTQSNKRRISADFGAGLQGGDGNVPGLSVFAISWLPEASDWGIAGSVATPYSSQTNWSGLFTEKLGETDLEMQRYTLDTFWRVNNTLAVSLGVDLYDVTAQLNSSGSSFSATGFSDVGLHAGMRWELSPFWIFGATFRQGADLTVQNSASSELSMTLPDELTLALAHDLADDEIRLELDVKRTNWSSLNSLDVVNAGVTSQSLSTSLKDAMDVSMGMTWFWRDTTQFRLGYGYMQGANELGAYQPAIADLDGHRFAAGMGGMAVGMHLDISVSGAIYPDATVTDSHAATYSGSYVTWMFTLTKKF